MVVLGSSRKGQIEQMSKVQLERNRILTLCRAMNESEGRNGRLLFYIEQEEDPGLAKCTCVLMERIWMNSSTGRQDYPQYGEELNIEGR